MKSTITLAECPSEVEQEVEEQIASRESQQAKAITCTMEALCAVTVGRPIGSNLGVLHILWMQVSGALLTSRGAIFPGLQAIGLETEEIRRAWTAFRYGNWKIEEMVQDWVKYVKQQGEWQEREYEGYRPRAVDLTPYWRPKLKGLKSKYYHPAADKALPAVVLGIVTRVGQIKEQRVAVITDLVRAALSDESDRKVKAQVVEQVTGALGEDEIAIFDAGFKLRELQAAGLERYEVRLAVNFTARRNELPAYKGTGRRPEYGKLIRPLKRRGKKGQVIAATPPDRVETWTEAGREFRAEFWDNLVLTHVKVDADNPTFTVVAVYDPRFTKPWLLACPLRLSGQTMHNLYQDRWPVEQVPLIGKQMLGGARQFVFAAESCQRLPELNLLAGSILTYLAATLPAVPTGFWDRKPKPTAGRLRRLLARVHFPKLHPLPGRLRKKGVVNDHLPKGILAHRRVKQASAA